MAKNTRKLLSGFLAVACLSIGANAVFTKTNSYTEGQFADVNANAWYAREVASAYELGFMNGTGDNVFDPNGNVTVAQGITMATRVNASFYGREIPNAKSENWYDMYIKYAQGNGILTENSFDSYTRNITRAEMATLFADAIPQEEYKAINKVEHIPDVVETEPYAEKVLMLYNAGIVMGSDDYGTFNPDSDIKRSECAAIINRVAVPENRKQGTLKEYNFKDAYQFAYTDGTYDNALANNTSVRENIVSGWRLDNRAGSERTSIEQLITGISDLSETEGTALIREFNKISGEKVTAEFSAVMSGNGAYVEFRDESGKPAYSIKIVDGNYSILNSDGKYTVLTKADGENKTSFRVYLDFMSGKSVTLINGVNYGEHSLLSDNTVNFRFGVDEKGTGGIVPGFVNMTANYGVYEMFDIFGVEDVYGWKSEGKVSVNDGELVLSEASSVTKDFDAIDVKYIAEALAIFPQGENASFSVLSGNKVAVEIKSENGNLVSGGKVVYPDFTENMWYRLRIEANPSTGKAEIIINGRSMGVVPLSSSETVNTLVMSAQSGSVKFDDIKVYTNVDHHDYVHRPLNKASFDDYIVAINVCSLWRDNGSHYGWACITPYDENKPVLGYYDEGNPETADWEIKYMVEHGIDVQALCWYGDTSEGPLKTPRLSYQLHDGIQQAKYENYMKYCLIWESSGTKKFGSQQFRENVIPYWFENYFLDENYFVLDNKIVINIYGCDLLAGNEYFGSAENAKAELEYLNEKAKEYGFDGFIFLGTGSTEIMEKIGVVGTAAYHWGLNGYKYDVNVDSNVKGALVSDKVYQVPTVSVGYNDFAWRAQKAPLMTLEDYAKTNEWVKNTYLPTYADKGTWQEKLVWLSTWNEYGEGTYVMPSGLNGFGYLDVLREAYTDLEGDHTDYVPTEAQAHRIQRMYPQYARLLRHQGSYAIENKQETYAVLEFDPATTILNNVSEPFYFNGGVSGVSAKGDFNANFVNLTGYDISKINAVKIIMQAPADNVVQVFFGTDTQPDFSESKSMSMNTQSGMCEYVFDFSNNPNWKGSLTGLRIDPANGVNLNFSIESVELISFVKSYNIDMNKKLYVNGNSIKSIIYPEVSGEQLLFPFDPETAIDHIMHTFMTWDYQKQTLTLEAKGHKAVFTVGSDKYTVDGIEKQLGHALYMRDGIPMLDMKLVCEALEFKYEIDGNNISITTVEESADSVSDGVEWDFDSYDTQSWESFNTNLLTNGKYLRLDNSDKQDTNPVLVLLNSPKLGFSAMKYNKLEVKIRYRYNSDSNQSLALYFITSLDNVWNERKVARTALNSTDSGDNWEVYTVDLSALSTWDGLVTSLRIDPFDALGYMEFDYIRFVADENYDESKDESAGIDLNSGGIINGDAESSVIIPFTHKATTVTIVEDNINNGNHAFKFEGPDKKAWTYMVHPYELEIGKTYRISFDAKAVSDSKGNEVALALGILFKYSASDGNDHYVGSLTLPKDGSWAHFEMNYTVTSMSTSDGASVACYASPPSETTSGVFLLDNLVVEEVVKD